MGAMTSRIIIGLVLATLAVCLSSDSRMVSADILAVEGTCSNGVTVNNPENTPLLVHDCNALLEARDTLAQGSRTPIWDVDTPMSKWD